MSLEHLHFDPPTQSIRDGKPLPEGFIPCATCASTRRAITDIYPMWKLSEIPADEPMPTEAPYVILQHWHDDGLPDDQWSNLKRYCHGHTCTTPDIKLEAHTREQLQAAWNAKQIIAHENLHPDEHAPTHLGRGPFFWMIALAFIYVAGYITCTYLHT